MTKGLGFRCRAARDINNAAKRLIYSPANFQVNDPIAKLALSLSRTCINDCKQCKTINL